MKYDIDFRKRCVVPNGDFDRIYYGHEAKDYDGPGADRVYDLISDFAGLSAGGRRPGSAEPLKRHFFNSRVEVSYGSDQAVQGGGDVDSVGAFDEEGGSYLLKEAEATARSAGGGDRAPSDIDTENNYGEDGDQSGTHAGDRHKDNW